jgi:hypothetical protein
MARSSLSVTSCHSNSAAITLSLDGVTLGCSQKEVLRNKQELHVGGCHMEKCLPCHWKLAKVMNGVEWPMSMG